MYLKRLELQGFKSFAPRTILEFSPGITAIVGPNGSGKSNIADAIRWVLGEQSMRQLRGKKSDDIIFVGGQGRAPMQMAEVGLVLDNAAGWLPSEHTEVSAARRSFRSGESEYLISGQRVRLRDLLLLLAQARIGHDSYTVIGQGLVDQALSVRPEERRGLFEDAAGIRQFQAQRTDAEQKLALTQTNLGRLRDILSEIEPRLGPLAEQARRARDYVSAREELRRVMRVWYTWRWSDLQAEAARMEGNSTQERERIESITHSLAAEDDLQRQTREQREDVVTQLAQLRRSRNDTNTRLQSLERDLAVGQERRTSLERQAADIEGDLRQQEEALANRQAQLGQLDEQTAEAERLQDTMSAEVDTLERGQHSLRQEQEREEARLRAVQRDAIQAQARLGATQTELGRLHKQLGERNRALAGRQEHTDAVARRADSADSALNELRLRFEAARDEVETLVSKREALQLERTSLQAAVDEAHIAVADTQRTHGALSDRLDLLRTWQNDVEGYAAAVRVILNAPESDRPRFIGSLAQLIEVREGYEAAVEAALGSFVHALVTATIQDAIACADWLRQRGGGFALILWADSPGSSGHPQSTPAPTREGLRPLTDFISIQPDLRPMLERLLRAVFVVDSLDSVLHVPAPDADPAAAGGQSDQSRPTITIATQMGEILHRDRWLRTGATSQTPPDATALNERARSDSVLSHERELRRLPEQIEHLSVQLASLTAQNKQLFAALAASQADSTELNQTIHDAELRAQELARQLTTLQRDEERAQSELRLSQAMVEQVKAEVAGLEEETEAARLRTIEHEQRQAEAAEAVQSSQETLDEILSRNRVEQEEIARQRTAVAVQRQELKTLLQRAEQVRLQMKELSLQITSRSEKRQAITAQQVELEQATADQQEAIAATRTSLRELSGEVGAQEASLAHLEGMLAQADRDQAVARQELSAAEADYRRAVVDEQRARDALDSLQGQMRDELIELGELSSEATLEDALGMLRLSATSRAQSQPPEQLGSSEGGASSAASLSGEESAKLRRQFDQLRNRLRQLGGFDPDAPQVYEELKTRHEFLNSQVRDMEQGAANLRSIIVELDATMRRQFAETFAAVNLRFQQHFTVLFSGGSARLELTAPRKRATDEDEAADGDESQSGQNAKGIGVGGIEVFVQIPGKRVQDLSLLSGGERAMVSAALLFALLETNPPPFCLLDEVDAALDEANVVRFCEILRQLAESTQFVVITHNRVTMTHAGAIYGVSMGADSVSRVLSMRLADIPTAS